MKRLIVILFAAFSLCACSSHNESGAPATLNDKLEELYQNTIDSTCSFEAYEPLLVEVLDSLEDMVCNSPNAEMRFMARRLPGKIFALIGNTESESRRDSIWHLYFYRRNKILSTWYVQQHADTIGNDPFIILSYAAPYDINGDDTRVGFVFSENNNSKQEPIMLVILPVINNNPLILFSSWDENFKEYHSCSYVWANHNIELYADSVHTTIVLSGSFLQDMLKYEQIQVCYIDDKVNPNNQLEDAPLEGRAKMIPVDLHYFQQQYDSAHKWLIEQASE